MRRVADAAGMEGPFAKPGKSDHDLPRPVCKGAKGTAQGCQPILADLRVASGGKA